MTLLGIYLELVMPKTYGGRRSPCFFITDCFEKREREKIDNTEVGEDADFETQFLNKNCYEAPSRAQVAKEETDGVLRITELFKTYDNGFKAVSGINLKMF